MEREMTVRDFLALLRGEIAERQKLVTEMEARIAPSPGRKSGQTAAAVEILRTAGRPMHGLQELLPALEAQGYVIGSRAGFGTGLLRTGQIVRTAPGTFAYKASVPANDADAL
jgi:hypothetical protein